jgi:peptidoglycan/xylan/chitin deacetylase (PgdA/CDA1 family)
MWALLLCFLRTTCSYSGSVPPDFWKAGTGLAVSFVFGLEAGGQPRIGAPPASPSYAEMAAHLAALNLPDYPTRTWYEYGIHEGIPRILSLFDTFGIKASCLISTEAALNSPQLAKEIVRRGHEAVCHGTTYSTALGSIEAEREFLIEKINITQKITGQRCSGFNALWMQHTPHTNSLLQELGFTYYVDDLSRDIPFTKLANDKPIAIVPYTFRNHDMQMTNKGYTSRDIYNQLTDEFEELYAESQKQRRMMTISIHDNVGGAPAYVQAYRRFLQDIIEKPNLWFARKDWLGTWAMANGPHYTCNSTDFICPASSCVAGCPTPNW